VSSADDPLLSALTALGLSTNEARAYRCLLVESPATGYELAQRAGVPRSAIYAVLRRLEEGGLAVQVEQSPARYAPLPVADLMGALRRRFEGSLRDLDEAVRRLAPPPPPVDLWNVSGYDAVLARADELLGGAERTAFLSVWRREAERLLPALSAASARGVRLVLFSFTSLDALPGLGGQCFSYGLEERAVEAFWSHKLILVVDHRRALMGSTEPLSAAAVVTGHPAILEVALNNVALDITLLGQRRGVDPTSAMVDMLGDRLGSLDPLVKGSLSR
jgi:predicted transcriptional regulator